MDLELPALRQFVAVAEELSFTNAARRLHMAQPPLSRSIRSLEAWLGAELFVRSTRRVELTAAGRELLAESYGVLQALDGAVSMTRQAARGERHLSIGFRPATSIPLLNPIISSFKRRQPGVELQLHRVDWQSQVNWILDGRVDVAFVLEPLSHPEIEVRSVFAAPRAVVVPESHPLATRPSVTIADLAPYPLGNPVGAPEDWRAFWTATPRRIDPGVPNPGPPATTSDETIAIVLSGSGLVLTIATVGESYGVFGLKFVPIADIEPAWVGLAWRRSNRSTVLRELVEHAVSVAKEVIATTANAQELGWLGPREIRKRSKPA